jgi:hypothetical protein
MLDASSMTEVIYRAIVMPNYEFGLVSPAVALLEARITTSGAGLVF